MTDQEIVAVCLRAKTGQIAGAQRLRDVRTAATGLRSIKRTPGLTGKSSTGLTKYQAACAAAGISRQTVYQWDHTVDVSDVDFEAYLLACAASGDEPTIKGLVRKSRPTTSRARSVSLNVLDHQYRRFKHQLADLTAGGDEVGTLLVDLVNRAHAEWMATR